MKGSGRSDSVHWCGATVISEEFIITAAHCLEDFPKGLYVMRVGDYNTDVGAVCWQKKKQKVDYIEIAGARRRGGRVLHWPALLPRRLQRRSSFEPRHCSGARENKVRSRHPIRFPCPTGLPSELESRVYSRFKLHYLRMGIFRSSRRSLRHQVTIGCRASASGRDMLGSVRLRRGEDQKRNALRRILGRWSRRLPGRFRRPTYLHGRGFV